MPPMAISSVRKAVFEALKAAVPHSFNGEMRRSFLSDGSSLKFEDLEMDSLSQMEFCIAIELSTGVTLLPSQLMELGSTDAVVRLLEAPV